MFCKFSVNTYRSSIKGRNVLGLVSAISTLAVGLLTVSPANAQASATGPMPGLYTTAFDYTPLPPYGLLLVHLTLDSGVPATFLIDTGTNVSAISRTLALKLGLTPKPAPEPVTMFGRQMDVVTVPMLKIGDFGLPNMRLVAWEDKELTNLVQHPVDGILAEDVLKYLGLLIDFPIHRITLFAPGGLTDTIVRQYGFTPASGLPLISSPGEAAYSVYYVPTGFRNGARTDQENLLVDTGSADTHISTRTCGSARPSGRCRHRGLFGFRACGFG